MVRVQPLVTVPTVVYSLRGFSLPTGCISRCYRADPASLSPSHSVPGCIQATRAVHGARGELRAVLHCHIHISQEITLTNPQVASFIETPAVPEKFFPSVFSLITVLITPSQPACFPLRCARAAHLHTESPLSVDRAWGWSQEFMRSYPQPASGLPCGLGK